MEGRPSAHVSHTTPGPNTIWILEEKGTGHFKILYNNSIKNFYFLFRDDKPEIWKDEYVITPNYRGLVWIQYYLSISLASRY